ncbi:TPA: hypothetical protein DD690_01305 [Candidatus Daviesbacteria bacterium]|nr:MAG: hypothetical protein A3D02_00215 [Candidatus Daviesbacteria bacterium RIFCSPHIGHO2_02_FULL_39_41]OGE45474.1 MAG: hypothetical protein A3E67_03805 [Candidatus Daviesbacteria bacterium RIFCSPHIGHO2_12_FULL_38_25]OGE67560.1 MAG: hypothetical protein A3H81_00950 [Candidatus Daviesbacteria bacterium RIFCSPLOWO2_02_FULL_38_18]OGE72780.1 MAG: hypothetical protein A3H18_03920 [Candidatus Daviesbacteria bacterium RIFCSPLOWO2_12_FULL_38_10]HBQ50601.1 hypothetical protein [Candidatus Daviesbacteri
MSEQLSSGKFNGVLERAKNAWAYVVPKDGTKLDMLQLGITDAYSIRMIWSGEFVLPVILSVGIRAIISIGIKPNRRNNG